MHNCRIQHINSHIHVFTSLSPLRWIDETCGCSTVNGLISADTSLNTCSQNWYYSDLDYYVYICDQSVYLSPSQASRQSVQNAAWKVWSPPRTDGGRTGVSAASMLTLSSHLCVFNVCVCILVAISCMVVRSKLKSTCLIFGYHSWQIHLVDRL